jgi:hypothetical protein
MKYEWNQGLFNFVANEIGLEDIYEITILKDLAEKYDLSVEQYENDCMAWEELSLWKDWDYIKSLNPKDMEFKRDNSDWTYLYYNEDVLLGIYKSNRTDDIKKRIFDYIKK